MPIVVALIVLGLLIYGAYWSFTTIDAHFGLPVAIGTAVVVIALIAAGVMRWLASRREIAPNLAKGEHGDWTHELKHDWGGVRDRDGRRVAGAARRQGRASRRMDLADAGSRRGAQVGAHPVAGDAGKL